jgi:hypothetical protein
MLHNYLCHYIPGAPENRVLSMYRIGADGERA